MTIPKRDTPQAQDDAAQDAEDPDVVVTQLFLEAGDYAGDINASA